MNIAQSPTLPLSEGFANDTDPTSALRLDSSCKAAISSPPSLSLWMRSPSSLGSLQHFLAPSSASGWNTWPLVLLLNTGTDSNTIELINILVSYKHHFVPALPVVIILV